VILKAKHHFLLDPFMRFYVIWKMKRSFHSFNIREKVKDKGLPVLLIGNHISWWDGIWALHVNRKLFNRKFHFMMLEVQLRKNWFLNYTGGFSVSRNTRQVIESIQYAAELLKVNQNLVLFFPQGEIESMHQLQFSFQKGIERILQSVNCEIQVVFLVCLVDYFSHVKPEVNAYLHDFTGKGKTTEIQKEFNSFYNDCISRQIKNTR
jgi:1-acyl-sn-glycerol-3-phosphate acyltransferase